MSDNLVMPEISDRFDVDDIRKIREYNAMRHINMTTQEMVDELNKNADEIVRKYGLRQPVQLNHL